MFHSFQEKIEITKKNRRNNFLFECLKISDLIDFFAKSAKTLLNFSNLIVDFCFKSSVLAIYRRRQKCACTKRKSIGNNRVNASDVLRYAYMS